MKRHVSVLGGLVFLAGGCAALPSSLLPSSIKPPTTTTTKTAIAPAGTCNLAVTVAIGADPDRRVQYNGPGSSLGNDDIADLVVGLFDNGTGTVFGLGYLYSGTAGGTITASSSAPAYLTDLGTRLGTLGTGSTISGYTIATGTPSNFRRYVLRDYLTGTNWISSSTTTTFTKIPVPTISSGLHPYIVFCAAYDSAANNLGYTEAAVPVPSSLTSTNPASSTSLTLNLSQNLLGPAGGSLIETPSLVNFIPTAS